MKTTYPTPQIARRFQALRRELSAIRRGDSRTGVRAAEIRNDIEDLLLMCGDPAAPKLLVEVRRLASPIALEAAEQDGYEARRAMRDAEISRLAREIREGRR